MSWLGEFRFGDTWAAYKGPTAGNTAHAHAAIQLVLCPADPIVVIDDGGREFTGQTLLIRPLVTHAVVASAMAAFLYIEPQSPIAAALLDVAGPDDISQLNSAASQWVDTSLPLERWLDGLERELAPRARALDLRLEEALAHLREQPGSTTVTHAADVCGISPARLRAIAQEQLGVPLATWLLWRKLESAARALACGQSFSEAALIGGFSDQAHFTRTMRKMFGITPTMAAIVLR